MKRFFSLAIILAAAGLYWFCQSKDTTTGLDKTAPKAKYVEIGGKIDVELDPDQVVTPPSGSATTATPTQPTVTNK